MKTIDQIRKEIEEEIEIRRELLREMVGDLYPAIVSEEITKLHRALGLLK